MTDNRRAQAEAMLKRAGYSQTPDDDQEIRRLQDRARPTHAVDDFAKANRARLKEATAAKIPTKDLPSPMGRDDNQVRDESWRPADKQKAYSDRG